MDHDTTRRGALKCPGLGTGTLFALSGRVLSGFDLAQAAEPGAAARVAARFALVAGIALAVALPAIAAPGDVEVKIKNFDFMPMAVTVPVGGQVTWKNLDGEPHTVTSTDGAFRSQALDEDDAYTFKFTRPGVYQYICTIHPKMRATVTVK
jgi:plastocyanin